MPRSPKADATGPRRKPVLEIREPAVPAWLRWIEKRPILFLALMTLASLMPSVAKPFHIDDPMYIWAAEHIRHHPLDFYGFDVAWSGYLGPMPMVMQNPPLASMVMAAASFVGGFSEVTMHLVLFIPAVLLVIGTFQLARQFCQKPVIAAALTLATPVFITCAGTVTNDILMVCFWVWSVYAWDRGLRQSNWGWLVFSAALLSLACMTKYPAMNLIPLLGAYTLIRRAPVKYLVALFIPVLVLVGYEYYTKHLYGRGLLSESMVYSAAVQSKRGAQAFTKTFVCLCFTGGCMAAVLFLSPVMWRIRGLALGIGLMIAAFAALAMLSHDALEQLNLYADYTVNLRIQVAIWLAVGVGALVMTASDYLRNRDAGSALLGLWIFGTFVFAGIVNWSVNGRTLLPMAPAVAIVLARRLETSGAWGLRWRTNYVGVAFVASLLLSVWVGFADHCVAWATRNAVERIMAKYKNQAPTIWFQGHWGLQYYLQKLGAQPWVPGKSALKVGDLMVVAQFNSNGALVREPLATRIDLFTEEHGIGVAAMNIALGAGFYSHLMGPLPFVFGQVPEERYLILRINVPATVMDEAASRPDVDGSIRATPR